MLRSPELQTQPRAERLTPIDVVVYADNELARIEPTLKKLLSDKHRIFGEDFAKGSIDDPDTSDFNPNLPIEEQTYDDPTYNNSLLKKDLGTRDNGILPFHNEIEKYDPLPDDTEKFARQKEQYRQEILDAAKGLGGFVPDAPGVAKSELDKRLSSLESTMPKIDQPVEAIVVAAAAALANYKRFNSAVENIASGKVQTKQILFTSGERTVPQPEKDKVAAAGFKAGDTEYESAQLAIEQLLGVEFDSDEQEMDVPYGDGTLKAKYVSTQAVIGDQLIDIKVVLAPMEPGRKIIDKYGNEKPANRANTDETFLALGELLSPDPGLIVIESHGEWQEYQEIIGMKTFGLEFGKQVIADGVYNSEKLYTRKDENGNAVVDIRVAESVIDEIAKCQDDLVKTRVAALNKLREEMGPEAAEIIERLMRPTPNMDELRMNKGNYRSIPIDSSHEKHNEPLVNLSDYGVAGQSYYSRPNAASVEAFPGVPKEIKVRQSIAEELSLINKLLDNPAITALFGSPVELYVEEGVRLPKVQKKLHKTYMPTLVRSQQPELDEDAVRAEASNLAAKAVVDGTPFPHQTGGAIDVILRFKQSTPDFVEGSEVPMGHFDGNTITTNPDHFDRHLPQTQAELTAQRNRRAFYHIMTGEAFGIQTDLSANPTEFWHWSRGDQLAAYVSGQTAYYSFPPEAES